MVFFDGSKRASSSFSPARPLRPFLKNERHFLIIAFPSPITTINRHQHTHPESERERTYKRLVEALRLAVQRRRRRRREAPPLLLFSLFLSPPGPHREEKRKIEGF